MKLCIEKGLNFWPTDWFLHHHNVLAHKALSVKQFLTQNRLLKWNTYLIPLILL
jgi:hypothetical protein